MENKYIYNGVTFKNIHKFKEFIEKYFINNDCYNLEAFLEELIQQFNNSGMCEYELSKNESKTKKAETISYSFCMINTTVFF